MSAMLTRRSTLALAGAGLFSAAAGGRSALAAPAEFKVQLNWFETGDFSPLFAAEKMGFDTALGIKQSFIPGGPQVDPVQSVAGGSAPVGIGASVAQLALARASGIPVKVLGAMYRGSPLGLISLADKPIKTPKDAVGKRIGLQGGARLNWAIILAANGLTADQMTIVPVGADVSPLVNHQVDGYWGTAVNQHITLELQGIANHIMIRNEIGAPEQFNLIFALESAIRSNRDQIVAWLKAVIKGEQYFMANPDDVSAYTVQRSPGLKLNPEQQKRQARALIDFVSPGGMTLPLLQIDEASAAKSIEQMDQQGALPAKVSLDDLLDRSLLAQAYA